jgi:transglutaminase-like putative cysteine protease/tetratricopeptide (TPR) repeat protein
MRKILFISIIFISANLSVAQITYQDPRVYNLDISFEMKPDYSLIERDKDLKLWMPLPREWDSQKNVQIISVEPDPHSQFTDPDYGNTILYWDLGKYPETPVLKVRIQARLLSYSIDTEIDTSLIKPYDTTTKEYKLYTQSGFTIHIAPKLKELAIEAIGNETNPYSQAKKITRYVHEKIRYDLNLRFNQGFEGSLDHMLSNPVRDEESGEEYFVGDCTHYSALFIAMCRSLGIPARCVCGRIGWDPFFEEKDPSSFANSDTTDLGFAGNEYNGLGIHTWSEFYLQDIGWIPVDANRGWFGLFGRLGHDKIIMSKGRDIFLGPYAPKANHEGYGFQWVPVRNGHVQDLQVAVYNIEKIAAAKSNVYHTLDPFPADALVEYSTILYPESLAEAKLINWRKDFLILILSYSLGNEVNHDDLFTNNPEMDFVRQEYLLHLLRQKTGKEKFHEILKNYQDLLLTKPQPVSTEEFREISESVYGASLDYFFDDMIHKSTLRELELDGVIDKLCELFTLKDTIRVVKTYKELKDANPDDYDFSNQQLNRLGVQLRNRSMFDESISVYKLIIELYPDWFEGYGGIADVYRLMGNKEQAIKYYTKSLELFSHPDYANFINRVIEELNEQDN